MIVRLKQKDRNYEQIVSLRKAIKGALKEGIFPKKFKEDLNAHEDRVLYLIGRNLRVALEECNQFLANRG